MLQLVTFFREAQQVVKMVLVKKKSSVSQLLCITQHILIRMLSSQNRTMWLVMLPFKPMLWQTKAWFHQIFLFFASRFHSTSCPVIIFI
jgi:hypothetical protein